MRFNTNVSANTKKSVELNNFLGVDFSSAPTNVSNKRASFAKNLLNIDGVNQKRPGWEELFNFGEGHPINGIFVNKFKRNGVIDEVMLVQAGGILYRVTYDANKQNYVTSKVNGEYVRYRDVNFKSQAFMSKNKLYIIGGGGYYVYAPQEQYMPFQETEEYINFDGQFDTRDKVYNSGDYVEFNGYIYRCNVDGLIGKENPPSGHKSESYGWNYKGNLYTLKSVINGKDTYIPTTTIGIMPNESGDTARTSLDKINLLSSYRINKLRGVGEEIAPSEVYLDTYDNKAKEGKTYYTRNENGEYVKANVSVGDEWEDTFHFQSNGYYEKHNAYTFKLDAEKVKPGTEVNIYIETESGKIEYKNEYWCGGIFVTTYDRFLFEFKIDENGSLVYVSPSGYIDHEKGLVYIFADVDIKPKTNTEDNIIVKYIPYDADSSITDCEFGCVFGYNGRDTLFLSGNKNYPNQDFYSYTVEEDFTYFPADNIEKFGSSATSVKAYLRVADGTLAVLKETSNTESTIYYRSASYVTNALGITEIRFPVVQGAFGEGAINAHTVGTLIGDNLFVSPNGVFGLTLADNVVVNERYARERDKFIHSQLIKHDLTNAVATVYQGRYWLSVDGVCYVMDSRFKSTSKEDKDDTFSYECYYLDNIPARCFGVYNNELYFGTDDGSVCKFTSDRYFDKNIIDLHIADISLYDESDGDSNTITIEKDLAQQYIKDGSELRFRIRRDSLDNIWFWGSEGGVYTDLVDKEVTSITRGDYHLDISFCEIQFKDDITNDFVVGQEICVSNGQNQFESLITYVSGNTIRFFDNSLDVSGNEIQIYRTNIRDKVLYVTEFDGVDTFKVCDEEGNIIKLYKQSSDILYAETVVKTPVQAIWQSAVLDLGLYDYSKCLDSLSVVLSPDFSGKVRFGYETKWVTLDLIAKQIKSAETETSHHFFNFDNIDFDNFTFETAFASSYTKRIRERNINYIMFKAVMDDDLNSALMSIKVDYTIYKKNRGVR
jgi:hypothetical protein